MTNIGNKRFHRALQARIHRGLNLTDTQRLAEDMEATVEIRPKTGEVRFSHALMEKSVLKNVRKRDTSQELVNWLRKLQAKLAQMGVEERDSFVPGTGHKGCVWKRR